MNAAARNKPENMTLTLQWEQPACNFCGSSETHPKLIGPDRLLGLPGMFTIVECATCGLYRQFPRPVWESLKAYYPEHYVSYTEHHSQITSRFRRFERRYGMWKRMRAVKGVCSKGRLLDVGCGSGNFLAEVQNHLGWDAIGIEPNASAANYATRHLPFEIVNSSFLEYSSSGEQFDVVTMWNVFEHLPYPLDALSHTNGLIKPGGWLIGSIPNMEGLDSRVFKDLWLGWDLPRHLYFFSRKLLNDALQASGFSLESVQCIASTYAAIRHDLEFWSQTWEPGKDFQKELLLGLYNFPLTKIALSPFYWLFDRMTLSPIVTFFAQKS